MGILFLIFTAIFAFAFITFIRKWHNLALLYTIAIGYAVNANIFNGMTVPVDVGGIVFAIDSILYTGAIFAIIICAHEFSIRHAQILTSSTIAAILVSAVIEFMATISYQGYNTAVLTHFSGYVFSSIGTFVAVWLMLAIFKRLKKKGVNLYLNFALCVFFANVVNTAIYYGFLILTSGIVENMWCVLLGSLIGKVFSICLGLFGYFINEKFWIPNSVKQQQLNEQNVETKNEKDLKK